METTLHASSCAFRRHRSEFECQTGFQLVAEVGATAHRRHASARAEGTGCIIPAATQLSDTWGLQERYADVSFLTLVAAAVVMVPTRQIATTMPRIPFSPCGAPRACSAETPRQFRSPMGRAPACQPCSLRSHFAETIYRAETAMATATEHSEPAPAVDLKCLGPADRGARDTRPKCQRGVRTTTCRQGRAPPSVARLQSSILQSDG